MISWTEIHAQERVEEARRNVEHWQLEHEATSANGKPPHFYSPALARLGGWLVERGSRLQEQHSPAQSQPPATTKMANPC